MEASNGLLSNSGKTVYNIDAHNFISKFISSARHFGAC
jgi:hypothetical protein